MPDLSTRDRQLDKQLYFSLPGECNERRRAMNKVFPVLFYQIYCLGNKNKPRTRQSTLPPDSLPCHRTDLLTPIKSNTEFIFVIQHTVADFWIKRSKEPKEKKVMSWNQWRGFTLKKSQSVQVHVVENRKRLKGIMSCELFLILFAKDVEKTVTSKQEIKR